MSGINPSFEPPFVLAIDMGTSSTRALLFDRLGRQLQETETQLPYEVTTTPDGGVELDPGMVLTFTARAVDGALENARRLGFPIELVAVSCFWHSLVGLDVGGVPVTPVYMWGDTRSRDDAAELRAAIDVEAYRRATGVTIHSSYWPAKLRWLRRTDPERFERVRRWTSAADYLLSTWLGVDRMAEAMATGTGLLALRSGSWDAEALRIAGIEAETVPPIVERSAPASGLRSPWSTRWPELAHLSWYPAVGDGACANVGSGATGIDRMALTLGTSGAVRGIVPGPVGAAFDVPAGLWAYRLDHDRLVIGAALSNGGNVPAWIAGLTGLPLTDASLGDYLDAPPDSHGLTLLPFLSGERAPLWSDTVTGVAAGLTLATSREALLRAGMEAVSLRLALIHDLLAPQLASGHAVIANGGALLGSPVWQRITCDAIGAPLTILASTDETAARGAALLALESHGVLVSLEDAFDPTVNRPILTPDLDAHAIYGGAGIRQSALQGAMAAAGFWV